MNVPLSLFLVGLLLLEETPVQIGASEIVTNPPPTYTECTCVCTNTSIQSTKTVFTKPSLIEELTEFPKSCAEFCHKIPYETEFESLTGFEAIEGSGAHIFPHFLDEEGLFVSCDCGNGSEGAWTVFQRRHDGSVDFFRNWTDYVVGFGNVVGEHWLGLETLHRFTTSGRYKLRIDLEDWGGNRRYAEYSTFEIEDSSTNYTLVVDSYSGNAGDAIGASSHMTNVTNLRPFTTRDRDNDNYPENCANAWHGAWWFSSCFGAHLNGVYSNIPQVSYGRGIIWENWLGFEYSLKKVEMKFREY